MQKPETKYWLTCLFCRLCPPVEFRGFMFEHCDSIKRPADAVQPTASAVKPTAPGFKFVFFKASSSLLGGKFLNLIGLSFLDPSFRITSCSNRNITSIAFMIALIFCCMNVLTSALKHSSLRYVKNFFLYRARKGKPRKLNEDNCFERAATPFLI